MRDFVRLSWILGKSSFWSFSLVTFLAVAVLGATYIASRHALKIYTEDQLRQLPWDITSYQHMAIPDSQKINELILSVSNITNGENFSFLRLSPPPWMTFKIGEGQIKAPNLSVISSSDLSLIHPELRPMARGENTVALVGPEDQIKTLLSRLELSKTITMFGQYPFKFSFSKVTALDRTEMNKWLLKNMGSVDYVPTLGIFLITSSYDLKEIINYDKYFRSSVGERVDIHEIVGEYYPEVVHLARVDRDSLVSGWDLQGSRDRVDAVIRKVKERMEPLGFPMYVTSDLLILLNRMIEIARIIGYVTILMALPVLWMAWVLSTNLVGLLLLNERRKIGLMRLRGVPKDLIKRSFFLILGVGGLLGGIVGLVLGNVIPLMVYEGPGFSLSLLKQIPNYWLLVGFLIVGIALALLRSRRFISYVSSVPPVELAKRVTTSEAMEFGVRFGSLEWIALAFGAYEILRWIFGFDLLSGLIPYTKRFVPLLDLIGLPLFLYGLVRLIASREAWIRSFLQAFSPFIGGRLKDFSLHHMAANPHRIANMVLVGALAAGITLTPSVTLKLFQDKANRATQIEMGAKALLLFNPAALLGRDLKGSLGNQLHALEGRVQPIMESLLKVDGISSLDLLVEATVPGIYAPGYGFSGVPLYLIKKPNSFLERIQYEESLGRGEPLSQIIRQIERGKVAVSGRYADFWKLSTGSHMLVGTDRDGGKEIIADVGGAITALPGMPQVIVEDRETYVTAQVDYLNHLFTRNAFLVAALGNPALQDMEAMVSCVELLVHSKGEIDRGLVQKNLYNLPVKPYEVKVLSEELRNMKKDMFITLTSGVLEVYLGGGLLVALCALFASALASFFEDRRTFALLRIRGASPRDIMRVISSQLYSPILQGVLIGAAVSIIAGYGISNLIWSLQRVATLLGLLPTKFYGFISSTNFWAILLLLAGLFGALTGIFALWSFRKTARESLSGR